MEIRLQKYIFVAHKQNIVSEIKNIIFDLGGVIINLDIPKTISEFNKLTNKPFESIYTQLQQTPIFDLFDKGQINETDFFIELNKSLDNPLTDKQLLDAWNAMLLDFPIHRLELLNQLKQRYRIFLLSNTNETHITRFEDDLYQQHGYKNLEPFFEKVYYSCRIGMRKPDREIFDFVLNDNSLNASETIFIDDSPQHVEGALKTGINAYLLSKEKDVKSLIEQLNLI
ncbi:MAG: HAD family phosphatase [Bacteroidia bacterium]|nr:HAD family phosphatase [Bacteroidia bacterium]